MSQCAACGTPLTLKIDSDEEDDYDQGATSLGIVVPDSVQLQCGCYFHWCVSFNVVTDVSTALTWTNVGNVFWMLMK